MKLGIPAIYEETFNTVFFNASQFESGKKYIFNGELDGSGKVVDRIYIRGNVTGIDITVNNAQFTAGNFYGNTKITFDMPCYQVEEINGKIFKTDPKPPFDKVPVLQATSLSTTTVLKAPGGAKKIIGGGNPTYI